MAYKYVQLTGNEATSFVERVKQFYKNNDYEFTERGDYDVNIFTLRDAAAAKANEFDDRLHSIYKVNGEWFVDIYDITSEPGDSYLRKKRVLSVHGAAILQPGSWKAYHTRGKHKGYDAVVQWNGFVTVWRDNNADGIPDYENSGGKTEHGGFGINIHMHKTLPDSFIENVRVPNKTLGAMSAGCTVFRSNDEFVNSFMKNIKERNKRYRSSMIAYTLANMADFAGVEESDPVPLFVTFPKLYVTPQHKLIEDTPVYDIYPSKEKGMLTKVIKKDTEILIHFNHYGDLGEYAKVSIPSEGIEAQYMSTVNIVEIEEGIDFFPTDTSDDPKNNPNANATEIDFTSKDYGVPYYDPSDARHKVVVETDFDSVTPENQLEVLEKGFEAGAKLILSENNKRSDKDYIEALKKTGFYDEPIYATQFFLDTSKSSKVIVLVESPHKNLLELDDSDAPTEYYYYQDYNLKSFKKAISQVTKFIKSMSQPIRSYKGRVVTFDTEREALNLESVPVGIHKIFTENGIQDILNKEGFIGIGWDVNMRVTFMEFSESEGAEAIRIKTGFETLNSRKAFASKRTQHLLRNLEGAFIWVSTRSGIPWKSFLDSYIDFEKVKLLEKDDMNFGPDKEGPPVKDPRELKSEDSFYANNKAKEKIRQDNLNRKDNVGSDFLDPKKFPRLKEQLDGAMEDVYKLFLNNVDVKGLMLDATKCLLQEQNFSNFQKMKNDYDVVAKEFENLKNDYETRSIKRLANYTLTIPSPPPIPTDDIAADIVNNLRNAVSSMVAAVITSTVTNVLDSITLSCGNKNPDKPNASITSDQISLPDISNLRGLQENLDELFSEGNINVDKLEDFLKDLANLLSPEEFCSLFEGEPTRDAMRVAMRLFKTVYCFFEVSSENEALDFFNAISFVVDLDACRDIISRALPDDLIDYFLCPPSTILRETLLSGRGMSEQQIRDQLTRERERSKKIAEDFIKQLRDGLPSPNIFCTTDEDGNLRKSSESFLDENLKATLRSTVESLLEPIYTSFTSEASEHVENLYSRVREDITIGTETVSIERRVLLPYVISHYKSLSSDLGIVNGVTVEIEDSSHRIPVLTTGHSTVESAAEILNEYISESDKCEPSQIPGIRIPPSFEEVTDILYEEIDGCALERMETARDADRPVPFIPLSNGGSDIVKQNVVETLCENKEDFNNELLPGFEGISEEANIFDYRQQQAADLIIPDDGLDGITSLDTDTGISLPDYGINITNQNLSASQQLNPSYIPECAKKMGFTVSYGERKVLAHKKMFNADISFLENNIGTSQGYTSLSYLKAVINNAYISHKVELTEGEKTAIYPEITKAYSDIKAKILATMLDEYLKNPYLTERRGKNIIDYVNFGPTPNETCDPHVLKLKQISDEILSSIEEEFCPETMLEDSPLERSMLKACVTATIRHYIVETLISAIITFPYITCNESALPPLTVEHIIERMKHQMASYGEDYYFKFLEQVAENSGNKSKSPRSILHEEINKQYKVIIGGLREVALLGTSSYTMGYNYTKTLKTLQKISDSTYEIPDSHDIRKEAFVLREAVDNKGEKGFKLYMLVGGKANLDNMATREGEEFIKVTIKGSELSRTSDTVERFLIPINSEIFYGKREMINLKEIRMLFGFAFPVQEYEASICIHEVESSTKNLFIANSFSETRDSLYSLFYAVYPDKDDWQKESPALLSVGGPVGLQAAIDYNFSGYKDIPCSEFSFNAGAQVCWGNPFKGLGFGFSLRAARDSALLLFKDYVEMNDPNIKFSAQLASLSKLACVNVPTTAYSGVLSLTPHLAMLFPPNALNATYNALGLGVYATNKSVSSDSKEGEDARRDIKESGLILPQYCGFPQTTTEPEVSEGTQQQPSYEEETIQQKQARINRENDEAEAELATLAFEMSEMYQTIDNTINNNNMMFVYKSTLSDSNKAELRENWANNQIIPSEDKFVSPYAATIAGWAQEYYDLKQRMQTLQALIENNKLEMSAQYRELFEDFEIPRDQEIEAEIIELNNRIDILDSQNSEVYDAMVSIRNNKNNYTKYGQEQLELGNALYPDELNENMRRHYRSLEERRGGYTEEAVRLQRQIYSLREEQERIRNS